MENLANENHLLTSSIEGWLRYNQARVGISHDYSFKKAAPTLEVVDEFVKDAIALYDGLRGGRWN